MKADIKLNFLFPIATAIMAVVWMYKGFFEYGLWDKGAGCPADGLFPVIIGAMLLIASLINMISSFKEEAVTFEKKALILLAALVLIYAFTKYIGFLPALFIFYVLWLLFFAKVGWKNTVIAAIVMFSIVYFAFSVWLKIPFPTGIFF